MIEWAVSHHGFCASTAQLRAISKSGRYNVSMSASTATLGITSRTAHEELEDYYQYVAGTPVDSNIRPIVLDVGALKSLLGSLPLVQHVLLHAEPPFRPYCGGRNFSNGSPLGQHLHRPLSLALASLERATSLTVEAVNWTWDAEILAGYIRAGELSAASLPRLRNVYLSTFFGGPGRLAATMALVPLLERVSLHLVLHERDDDCAYAITVRASHPGRTSCAFAPLHAVKTLLKYVRISCLQALQVVLPAVESITIHNDIYTPPDVAFPEQWFAGVEEFIFSDQTSVEYDNEWFTMNTVSFRQSNHV